MKKIIYSFFVVTLASCSNTSTEVTEIIKDTITTDTIKITTTDTTANLKKDTVVKVQ